MRDARSGSAGGFTSDGLVSEDLKPQSESFVAQIGFASGREEGKIAKGS